ncbi:MAG TPA: quinone-dependent dihydroorotate dehydrogenase [Bauldia sp.]|nr:quinone-dependent dihydroorotate dehydrogenase [Bauldia sp.]
MSRLYSLLRPLLFGLDPEHAHRLAIRALASGLLPHRPPPDDTRLGRHLMGLSFLNPVGMAAGFDKNAEAVDGLFALGFGFVEVGTVTPLPQAGNPRPRLFRLPGDRAIINRFGFNSDGHDAVHRRLSARRRTGIVGVNLGANKDSSDRAADYARGVERFADIADYVTINVSSPNTPGLRDLQEAEALKRLLGLVMAAKAGAPREPPILLKIAPDLDDPSLAAVTEAAINAGVDGLIIANTTLSREGLSDPEKREAGGMSGRPLAARAMAMLAKARRLVGREMALVGAGGIDSAGTAWARIAAGADLVQIYSGMIYEGPGLVRTILEGLSERLDRSGLASIAAAVGGEAAG